MPRAANRSRSRAASDLSRLVGCLEAAQARRRPLLADPGSDCCRLFNGAADGIPGLVVEKLADVLVVQLHEGRLALARGQVRRLCDHLRRRLGARAVYAKLFPRDRTRLVARAEAQNRRARPWIGATVPAELAVREQGARFLVRPYDGYSVGLFLEQRDNRARVRRLARGREVLNAFAYTCAFSVAAALGGAAGTVSVDVSGRCLEWGRRNFAANGLGLAGHSLVCADIFDYFRRARRQRRRFALIVLDPPTFARLKRPRRTFIIGAALDRLVAGALELLEADGWLLLATNHRGTSAARLAQAVRQAAAASHRRASVRRLCLPLDFRGDPAYAKSILARLG